MSADHPQTPTPGSPAPSWLESMLIRIGAAYQRFGRKGLEEHALADVQMYFQSRQLALRDSPKGQNLSEAQQAKNRLLELEVNDISHYLAAQRALAGADRPHSLAQMRAMAQQQSQQRPQHYQSKDTGRGR